MVKGEPHIFLRVNNKYFPCQYSFPVRFGHCHNIFFSKSFYGESYDDNPDNERFGTMRKSIMYLYVFRI